MGKVAGGQVSGTHKVPGLKFNGAYSKRCLMRTHRDHLFII